MPAYVHVGKVARRLWSAVHGEVLGSRDDAVITGIVALHSRDKRDRHARAEEGIFAVGFLATTPAWIAKDVTFGAQKSRPSKMFECPARSACACLMRPSMPMAVASLVNEWRVESGRKSRGLGELRCAVGGNPVKRLAPPVVGRHPESRDRSSLVDELGRLFLESHAVHQIGRPLLRGECRILEGSVAVSCARAPADRSAALIRTANGGFPKSLTVPQTSAR